jgi:hypothetical protein
MNPYYQPPRYDAPREDEEREVAPPGPENGTGRRGWYFYVGGFFLLAAGVCLVLSNSLDWHPSPTLPPRVPPAATGAGK